MPQIVKAKLEDILVYTGKLGHTLYLFSSKCINAIPRKATLWSRRKLMPSLSVIEAMREE